MTFEEIREMVNATINENGLKQITGKALNLALTETLAAIEEHLANGSGGGLETVYMEETLTSKQQAANAAVFAKAKAAYEAGQPLPGVQVCVPPSALGGAGAVVCEIAMMVGYIAPDTEAATNIGNAGLLIVAGSGAVSIFVNEDGTLTAIQ